MGPLGVAPTSESYNFTGAPATSMKHSRELKVGAAIIIAAVLFFIGIRFFEDVPVFRGTYELYTDFDDAQGLMSGNAVRVRGVNVGSVESISIRDDAPGVRVRFHVDRKVAVPQGTTASIAGIAALNGVRIDLLLGPRSNPPIASDGYVPGESSSSMADLTERAPLLIDRLDSVLDGAGSTFRRVDLLLRDTQPELTQTLRSFRGASETLDQTVRAQQARLTTTLENLEAFSSDLRAFTTDNRDSLDLLVSRMNESFTRLNTNLEALETTSASLSHILGGVEEGRGTAGRLINDPALYLRIDSTLTALNRLIADFQTNPGRYFEDLRLVDIF